MKRRMFKKVLSYLLCIVLVCGICIIPQNLKAEATSYKNSALYDFSNNSGTLYSGTVADSNGINRQVARAFFEGKNEELNISNTLESNKAGTSGFLLNDANGLFELRANSTYSISFKIKVVSSQVSFKYNNYTYPTATQLTELKVAYGMPATFAANSISADSEVGLVVKVGTDKTTFTANQNGVDGTYNVGQWYSFNYTFKTPESFGDNGNVLGFSLKSFNGINIIIDDVQVDYHASIKVDPCGGTMSQTVFPHKIGDRVNIETPKYKFGYDFDGWYYDKEYTKPFTDEYITEENADAKLYAKWSTTRFGFEGYTPCDPKYGFNPIFYDIIEAEDAPQGKNVFYYHYTEEYWNKIHSGSVEAGNVVYYSARRTSSENNLSLKKVEPNTDYVITFKYKITKDSSDVTVYPATAFSNIWVAGTCVMYKESTITLTADTPDVWQDARIAFRTGNLEKVNGMQTNDARLMLYAANHVHTELYIDDITIEKVEGESTVKLVANGGAFKDGTTVKEQKVNVGDSIVTLENPIITNYDFGGWSFNASGTDSVLTDKIDSTVFRNTLYAKWTQNMGFESYYYDLSSANRGNYLSENVSIVNNNVYEGNYAAKLVNNSSAKQNVIALNPINDKRRYLVTFFYNLENATSDIKVKFASMNMNINDANDVKYYPETYKISASEKGSGYVMGAVIIDTDFASANANRLAMIVSSDSSSTYTIYLDSISVTPMEEDEGYIIYSDANCSLSKAEIGKLGEKVSLYTPKPAVGKFLGWYSNKEMTSIYSGDAVYSTSLNRIYIKNVAGEGFEKDTVSGSNITVTQDPTNALNKYLTISGSANFKLGNVTSGKKYAVEYDYDLVSADGYVIVSAGNSTKTLNVSAAGSGRKHDTIIVTANSSELKFKVAPQASVEMLIDNVVYYEIDENISVITFDQQEGYGEDYISVGGINTKIDMPNVSSRADYVFYGWYTDAELKNVFFDDVYTKGDKTLYARWAVNNVTNVNFENVFDGNYLTPENSNRTYLDTANIKDGKYCMVFDKEDETDDSDIYTPIFNENGYVKLESNTTYAVSYNYWYHAYTSSAKMSFAFYAASSDKFENPFKVSETETVTYNASYRPGYMYITTGELNDSNNTLYIKISSGTKKTTMRLDAIKITRVDEGRNHVFLYDDFWIKLYEANGNYGEKIAFPNLDTEKLIIEGWYNDVEVTDHYEEETHKKEPVSELFCRWELPLITFDNYYHSSRVNDSRYTFGDDMSITTEEQYDSASSLKYSYNYAIKYFETPNNTVGLGRVNDNSTYKITFKYMIKEAQSDVDIKFLTAHLTNRWTFITNYEEATYRIYSSEIGDGWKEATVYLTTKFESIGASGIFMTFNPVVEGPTVVYIDAVELTYLKKGAAIASFIGNDGVVVDYKVGKEGDTVTAPNVVPASQFAIFNGWFVDKECTEEFSKMTLSEGTNIVYSNWTKQMESFDNYTYASNDSNNYSQHNSIENGVLTYSNESSNNAVANGFRIGKLANNTSYKISFKYKANSANSKIKFVTADEMNIGKNTTVYSDEGNFINANGDGAWHEAVVYITTTFTYTVPNDGNVNDAENKNADYGDMLYMYFENGENAEISIDDVKAEEVEAVFHNGYSVLTDAASKELGSQALRFYFSYKTENVLSINIGGKDFTVVERGMIFKNAKNTSTGIINGDSVTVKPIVLANKNDSGYICVSKTSGFNQYWNYDNKTESIVYSGYIKNFNLNDIRLIAARGYIKVKDENGNIYTFYSADRKTTVKEGVDINSEYTDKDVHTIAGNTWDKYTIVNPKIMPYIYGEQIEFLIDYAKNTHKVTLNRVTEKAAETTYEIVIGDTTRATSDLVSIESEDQYVIAVRGTKLIINGGNDLAVMQGVKDFIEYLKLKDSLNCGVDLVDGYTKYGTTSKTADDYKLTFNDEFEGSNLDASKWGAYNNENINSHVVSPTQFGGKICMRAPFDPGYTTASGMVVDKPTFVRDGNAVITTARINETDFTFSRVSTFWNMVYQYGILEFRVKLAPNPVHTSLWMNGAGTSGSKFINSLGREYRGCMTEYDLLENYGRVNNYDSAIHHWWGGTSVRDPAHVSLADSYGYGTKDQSYTPDEDEVDIYDSYHIFTFKWSNDGIVFAFDGVKYYEFPVYDTYFERMANYIIIGCGMGNRDYGSPYKKDVHSDYYEDLVDYVRLYQIENMGSRIKYANK